MHPGDRERIRDLIERGHGTGRQFSFEHRIVLRNGETRWVVQENIPVEDGTGATGKRRGTVQHITERKLAEQELENSEAHHCLHMDSVPA